jgi:hypothetical protein
MRLGQGVHNRSQKNEYEKIKAKNQVPKFVKNKK